MWENVEKKEEAKTRQPGRNAFNAAVSQYLHDNIFTRING